MSHIATIETEIRDVAALREACRRLRLEAPMHGEAKLFSGSKTGWQVQLAEWRYPVVCDVTSGRIHFDHYNGQWGKPAQLDELIQSYAVEKTRIESHKQGHSLTETRLDDGSVKLTIQVGNGGAA